MFLFLINTSCEGNKDCVRKTKLKAFQYKRQNKELPHGNKHKPSGNIHSPKRSFKSCFDFDIHVKSEAGVLDFFCSGHDLDNPTEKENNNHFGLLVPFSQVASSAAFASFYHTVQ